LRIVVNEQNCRSGQVDFRRCFRSMLFHDVYAIMCGSQEENLEIYP
jgi:hypothetical protein